MKANKLFLLAGLLLSGSMIPITAQKKKEKKQQREQAVREAVDAKAYKINVDRAADAAWQRNEAISNNIANVDTPGYKRQDVAFESVLQQALGNNRYESMDDKVANVDLSRLRGRAYLDYANYSYRLDGNNVDIENENVMLAENQLKYQGLISSINQEFTNLKTVMK